MSDANAGVALAAVALVPSIFGTFLPPVAEVRARADDGGHLAGALRTAALTAAVTVIGVGVVTRSRAATAAGALAVAGYALMYGHAAHLAP